MNNCILAHNDLDGLYSAMLFYNSHDIPIREFRSIDYGQDHSTLKDQFDNFFIFDFSENPGGEKTTLWVDHHLRQKDGAEFQVIGKAPSCVRLMVDKGIINKDLLPEEDLLCIDRVDSATYNWSEINPEELIFPTIKNGKIGKYITLNQLLRKNRKNGLAEKLFSSPLNIDVLLYKIEKDGGPKTIKYGAYIESKRKLLERMTKESEKYIKYFSGVPVLFTKDFTQKDWKGYDLNLFGFLVKTSPYLIIIFDFTSGINVQIVKNTFYEGEVEPIYGIIKEDLDGDPRGHESIINLSFKTHREAITKLDSVIKKLSAHL